MKIDLNLIEDCIKTSNLSELSRETGIPYRTLQDWRLEKNNRLKQTIERLTRIQEYINDNR